MRLEYYMNESIPISTITNFYKSIAKMNQSTFQAQLHQGWDDFVGKIRENEGKEERLLAFIHNIFHVKLDSLDDVDLKGLKHSLELVKAEYETFSEAIMFPELYHIICRMQEFIAVVGIGSFLWGAIVLRLLAKEPKKAVTPIVQFVGKKSRVR